VPEILATNPRHYVEPFLGGGAIALALPGRLTKRLADVNPQLIDCWLCMKCIPGPLYRDLDEVVAEFGNGAAGYVKARDAFNKMIGNPRPMWSRRSALFMYLNARCFNGLWRVHQTRGTFNVPFGKLENPRSFHWDDDFLPCSQALVSATIAADHFAKTIGHEMQRVAPFLKRGDVDGARHALEGVAIYSDPPYHGTFDGYAKDGFSDDDQLLLANMLSGAVQAGAAVWASNRDTEFVRSIYSWAQIEVLEEQHSIGSKADRRGKRGCVLIRGGKAVQ
jgi:DNA adenine methylase